MDQNVKIYVATAVLFLLFAVVLPLAMRKPKKKGAPPDPES